VRRLLELDIDASNAARRRLADERKGDDCGGQHRALPREDKADAERSFEPAAEPAAPADDDEQVVAEHGRRQHHRQEQDRIDELAAREAQPRQGEAGGNAQDQVERRRPQGDLERKA
jgi:hypothetical protein